MAKAKVEELEQQYKNLLNLCLDCWFQFACEYRGTYHDGGLSTLERLRVALKEAGLIDEKGKAVEQ